MKDLSQKIWDQWRETLASNIEFGPKVTATLDDLINKIIQMLETHIGCPVKEKSTPTPSAMVLLKNDEEEEEEGINYTKHCSLDGRAMYSTTKIMIEGSNAVFELTKLFEAPQKQY